MLVRMRRVDVVAPRSSAHRVLRSIHRVGILHLTGFEPLPGSSPTTFARACRVGRATADSSTPYDGAAERIAVPTGMSPRSAFVLVAHLWDLDDAGLLGASRCLSRSAGWRRAVAARVNFAAT
jgi:hypothetical protein